MSERETRVTDHEKIVDMDGYNNNLVARLSVADAALAVEALEPPSRHLRMKYRIQDTATTLLHAIETLLELPHPVFASQFAGELFGPALARSESR